MTVLLRPQESPMALDRARRREHAIENSKFRPGPPDLASRRPVFWSNPARQGIKTDRAVSPAHLRGIDGATARFGRFAPVLAGLFPDVPDGSLRSRLVAVPALARSLGLGPGDGQLLVKADAELPIAGSIKARGGIHAVLEIAERLASDAGLIGSGDRRPLVLPTARSLFARHEISVGSTGNLGLGIGMAAAALGFRVTVHMSADAKDWKKRRLRDEGVRVVEHAGDYAGALAAGRVAAQDDPDATFIDDEDSLSLLYGYATAAAELAAQLGAAGITVNADHPLIVHLPCGVGGAPTGIALGLQAMFGSAVHCLFAEPVEAPCFLLAATDELDRLLSVHDAGLTGVTLADGLAVPRASRVAVDIARPIIAGGYTVRDEAMVRHLFLARRDAGLRLEPSAAAGISGPAMLSGSSGGRRYLAASGLGARLAYATQIVWTTGGRLTPDTEFDALYERGGALDRTDAAATISEQGA